MNAQKWIQNFTVTDEDVETLQNLMLEDEKPMTEQDMVTILLERQFEAQQAAFEAQYEGTFVYRPAETYEVGTRLVFTQMDLATATVKDIRLGENPDYGSFDVIMVEFDEDDRNHERGYREFAANFPHVHPLNRAEAENPLEQETVFSAEDILESPVGPRLVRKMRDSLREVDSLVRVAGYWFPRELVIESDIGTLHLSEAVLDMVGGGPLTTSEILEQIGGMGDAAHSLQIFSLNLALNEDERFEEVGPAGRVMWYLKRMMPDQLSRPPRWLRYELAEYDDEALTAELYDLETELDDEQTPIDFEGRLRKATSTLIYPHRRAGTIPLNAKNRAIFPRSHTPRMYIEMVDAQDGEKFDTWVVHEHNYVYGLLKYYEKYGLPVGAFVSVERGEYPGQIIISHDGYKARTEYVRILVPKDNQFTFENKKRAVGADFDELMLIGVDDLDGVDKLWKIYEKKQIATILRELINEIGKLNPQGTVHAVTLYSAFNVLRRCAPGPIFATLVTNSDFEDFGDYYWKLNT